MEKRLSFSGQGTTSPSGHQKPDRRTKRTRLIGYAIDARRQRFPDETPCLYKPHADAGERYVWNNQARAGLKDYNLLDLSI